MKSFRLCGVSIFSIILAAASVFAAANDNNVEWNGLRHAKEMRWPQWPARATTLTLELRTFHMDVTGAEARVSGAQSSRQAFAWIREDGTFDYWQARIPAAAMDQESAYYGIIIRDGTDSVYLNRAGIRKGEGPADGDFFIDLSPCANHPLGATVLPAGADSASSEGVVFRVWSPYAGKIEVIGSWNDWTTPTLLRKNATEWTAFVPAARKDDEYRFRMNGDANFQKPDPRGRRMTSSVGNSIVTDPSRFVWDGDAHYTIPSRSEMVIYELHVGTFSGNGDGVANWPAKFNDLTDHHLDYLAEEGVNAIELLPVQECSGDLSWGYNPSGQYSPEAALGTPDDFRRLVNECHRRGIAVLLDVKYNASGPSDNWLVLFDDTFNETYFYPEDSPNRHGGGVIGDRYNYWRTEVRDYLIDNALMWMGEYHVDGFRFDHTTLIKDLPSGSGDGWTFLREITDAIRWQNPQAMIIAEQWGNDSGVVTPTWLGGAGFDAQWSESFKNNMLAQLGALKNPGASANMNAVRDGLAHWGYAAGAMVNYVESHDEAGCFDTEKDCYGQRIVSRVAGDVNSEWAVGRSKLAGAAVLFSPGIPMIYMGQEWMEFMVWSLRAEPYDHRPNWARRDQWASVALFFRDAIRTRRLYWGMRTDASSNIHHVDDANDVIAFQRWTSYGDDLIVVLNFNWQNLYNYRIGFPSAGTWREIINSDAQVYSGGGAGNAGSVTAESIAWDGMGASASMTIPRMGALVFCKTRMNWPDPTPSPTPTATQSVTETATPQASESPAPSPSFSPSPAATSTPGPVSYRENWIIQ